MTQKNENRKRIAENKKALFQYLVLDRWEAGIVLSGDEVKAVRRNQVNFKDSYVQIDQGECYLIGFHIAYTKSYATAYPDRKRKLLLHKAEIRRLASKVIEKGLTIIPLSIYLKENLVKIEIGTAKGKTLYDKRQSIKEKELKQNIRKEFW